MNAGRQLPMAPMGHGRARSPFGMAAPSIVLALGYAAATLGWVAIGDRLPGGRWFAVHLFTLGVLTNLVLTFSEHFSRTVTRAQGERAAWWPAVTNAGIGAVLVGRLADQPIVLAAGAATLTVTVFLAYRRLRRMRHEAVGARFGWIVRLYERSHGAFIHGALLGALLGVGVVPGAWYGGVRLAHLHANVLGWGALTLLATLVFFGPTMARTRIEPGADARAARAGRMGATGLSLAVVAFLLLGVGGHVGLVARIVAGAGLTLLAAASTVICLPVARAVASGRRTASRPFVLGVCLWVPLVIWVDAVVVLTGQWRWLDAVGLAALAGALAAAMLATLLYLAPMLLGRSIGARERIRHRTELGATTRAVAFNLAVLLLAVGAAPIELAQGLPVVGVGWTVIAVVAVSAVVPTLPLRLELDGA